MIIGVHGFDYDPADPAHSPNATFALWQQMVNQPVTGFPWYSGRLSLRGEERALAAGYPDQYEYSYRSLAPAAAAKLVEVIRVARGPVDGIGHSLGTRVWLLALAALPAGYVRRLLFLNGAVLQNDVTLGLPAGVEVLNVQVRGDLVLRDLGDRFSGRTGACIGQAGYTGSGWWQVTLDDAPTQAVALDKRGWDLQGRPLDRLDLDPVDTHSFSYDWRGNWPLYRAWLAGDPLTDLAPPAGETAIPGGAQGVV
jgi:hypothetical protein